MAFKLPIPGAYLRAFTWLAVLTIAGGGIGGALGFGIGAVLGSGLIGAVAGAIVGAILAIVMWISDQMT